MGSKGELRVRRGRLGHVQNLLGTVGGPRWPGVARDGEAKGKDVKEDGIPRAGGKGTGREGHGGLFLRIHGFLSPLVLVDLIWFVEWLIQLMVPLFAAALCLFVFCICRDESGAFG